MALITRKKEIVLQDCAGDVSKQWLIRYYVLEKDEPVRVREIVKKSLSKEERYAFAQERIAYLSKFQDLKGHVIFPSGEKNNKEEKRKNTILYILAEAMSSKLATVSARMKYTYKPAFQHFKKFVGEKKTIKEFHKSDAYLFRNYLLESELKKKTINNYMSAVRELYSEAGRIGLVEETHNPFSKIPLLSVRMKAQEVFSHEHFKMIYDYCKEHDHVLFMFIMFMFYTCNRPDALRLLRVEDIDLKNKTIRFLAENQKTGVRKFQPISDAFLEELIRMNLNKYPANSYFFGHEGEPAPTKVGFNFFSKRHRAMLEALNLKPFQYKMYAWKHTGAVYLYNSIRDLKRVSEHLFHTDIKTTLVYLQRYGVVFGDSEFEKKAPKFGA